MKNFLGIKNNEKQKQGFQAIWFETLKFLGFALLLWCNIAVAGDLLEVDIDSEEQLQTLQSLVPDIEIINENKINRLLRFMVEMVWLMQM